MKFITLYILFLMLSATAGAQHLKGHVYEMKNTKKIPLENVIIFWEGTQIFTLTDSAGMYHIPAQKGWLVASLVGYKKDSVLVSENTNTDFILSIGYEAQTIEIKGEKLKTGINSADVKYQQIITSGELRRAACCNLSESFETNASVDVNYPDALTGARQIRMLGLEGVYTQMLRENIPTLKGLSNTYGLSFVPGTWVQSIQITKGAGSVVNGPESMAGQINLELQKPFEAEKIFVNLYGDEMGRSEANVHYAQILSGKLATTLLAHGSFLPFKHDRNKDGFLDAPLFNQYNFYNKWEYFDGNRIEFQAGLMGLYQNRTGGQMSFAPELHKLSATYYGTGVNTQRWEAFAKAGYLFPNEKDRSLGSQFSFTHHKQENYFGQKTYSASENNFYMNLIHQNTYRKYHQLKFGTSLNYNQREEKINLLIKTDTLLSKEIMPGGFAEYSFIYLTKFTAEAGLRADYHNIYGLMLTPRMHIKYSPLDNTSFRLSAGKGYRTPHIYSENQSIWASNRMLKWDGKTPQEISWNYGGSLTQNFTIDTKRKGFVSVDFFRTDFVSQMITDLDKSINSVYIYSLNGKSFANSFQAELSMSPIKNLELRTAWKYTDARSTYHGVLYEKSLQPKTRFLFTASYTTQYKKWMIDATALRYGSTRLPYQFPDTVYIIPELAKQYSQPYWIFHLQLTRNFKYMSVYAGVENLLDYRQTNPIVSADNPFSNNFDASMLYAPTDGRRIYAGLRWKLE